MTPRVNPQVQKAKIPPLDDSSTVPLVEPTVPDPDPVSLANAAAPESPDPVPQHGLLLETAVPRFSTEEKTKSGDMLLGGALPKRLMFGVFSYKSWK